MPDSREPSAEEENRAAAALERGIAEINTPAEAAKTLDALESAAGNLREVEVADGHPDASPEQQTSALEHAASDSPSSAKAAEVITTAATASARAATPDKPLVDEAVATAFGGAEQGNTRRGRRLLRHELFRRLGPLQALDAILFVQVNSLPHTRLSDGFMKRLSWVMTGGGGWFLILLVSMLTDRRRGWHAARAVAPALWLATATVEYPIKRWFRRSRPFVSLLRAIIVGRKPGSYSFPSGHSAAAFAGALLLARQYPRRTRSFFSLAGLVAFSRVYLGAHYPGDVVSGSFLGMLLARTYSKAMQKLGISPRGRTRRLR